MINVHGFASQSLHSFIKYMHDGISTILVKKNLMMIEYIISAGEHCYKSVQQNQETGLRVQR